MADMHRVRTSLAYFEEFGWEPTVVTVDEKYADTVTDDLLIQSVPESVKIYKVKALSRQITSKLGLSSLALRSMPYYRQKVNVILKHEKFDLVYFSTTQFMICSLGAYWKKHFNVPYVIDMQDPWYSVHYKNKPRDQRPPKYWVAYTLHKYLESIAIKQVDGLISVSDNYIDDLKNRYPIIKNIPAATITFGAYESDVKVAAENQNQFIPLLQAGFINIVYIGRGGTDMHKAITPVFEALKNGLSGEPELFKKLKFYFIGTSYAPAGEGTPTILPLAKQHGVEQYVVEITDRIGYFHALTTLLQANALFIPGSDDSKYTASKVFPYLLTQKPLLAIFNKTSNAVQVLNECSNNATVLTFNNTETNLTEALYPILYNWANSLFEPVKLSANFEKYSSKNLTGKQTELFNKAISHFNETNNRVWG
jgi:hypothetical protein